MKGYQGRILHVDLTKGEFAVEEPNEAFYRKYMGGGLPPDLHLYVRTDKDLPIVYKKDALVYLKEVGWKPKPVLSLPTWIGTYPSKVPPDAVIH